MPDHSGATRRGRFIYVDDTSFLRVMNGVRHERERQDRQWGRQDHRPVLWLAILAEEFGEAAKSVLENDIKNYRAELVQVAAVAIAAIEAYDRWANE